MNRFAKGRMIDYLHVRRMTTGGQGLLGAVAPVGLAAAEWRP
jgi:hypothetical protein